MSYRVLAKQTDNSVPIRTAQINNTDWDGSSALPLGWI